MGLRDGYASFWRDLEHVLGPEIAGEVKAELEQKARGKSTELAIAGAGYVADARSRLEKEFGPRGARALERVLMHHAGPTLAKLRKAFG